LLHLLQPIWLLASAGILVPVAIHLWNIRQGKTLKIGSIEFLARTAQQHARSLRLTELFLLLLRCLLISLLAVLLAKPYWQNTAQQKGWIVVQKKNASKAYVAYQPLMDSLLKAGYGLHLFEKGFAETEPAKIKAIPNDTATAENISYWELVKMLDRQLLPGMPVYLFTENTIGHFTGERPQINIALTWKTFAPEDNVHSFIANAYQANSDSIAVVMGGSTASGTGYHLQMLSTNQPRQKNFTINVSEGKMQVAHQDDEPVDVDTATIRITVFADAALADARYVQSAIQSVQQVTGRKIILRTVSKPQELSGKADWLFWLSDNAVPAQVNAKHVLQYPKGKTVALQSWIQENNNAQDQIELYQRIAYDQKNKTVLWRDGFGVPLLVKEMSEGKQFYYCYTHFNPSWNELVWHASFPQVIYELINGAPKQMIDSNDHRMIDEAQLQLPVTTTIKKATLPDSVDTTGTKRVLWSIIFVLFFIERYFSFRIKKQNSNA
jgi:hypothetical protein